MVSRSQVLLVVVVGLFVGFWVLRALLADSEPPPAAQSEPPAVSVEAADEQQAAPVFVGLVEPPVGGGSSPWGLVQRMY